MAVLVTGITIAIAAVNVGVKPSRAADDCLAGPNAATPQGSHWYYRVDRATHRECWYLGPERRTHAHQDASPARSHPSNSNTMSVQPASQTPSEARTAEAAEAGPLAAVPLTVEMASVQTKTATSVAAEPVPVEKAPDQVDNAGIDGSEIEQ
jgi:hypothetical protein